MNRRDFLKLGALLTASNVLAKTTLVSKEIEHASKQVKFCAFADIHYCPGVFPHDSVEWLDRILNRAEKEKVDFIIQAGDFAHNPKKDIKYVNHYNDFKIKTYHVLGNHDHDGNPYQDTLEAYRMKNGYYAFEKNGFKFIVLDPNYINENGKFIHYSASNYYTKNSTEWVPPEQLDWLRETLDRSTLPCIILSHESFERERMAIHNFMQIRNILNSANKKCPGKVRLCINGHHHRDFIRILDDIIYLELNSASMEWVNKAHDKYAVDICKKWSLAAHTVFWNDPISSIITLSHDGSFCIKGDKSSFYRGIRAEMTGNDAVDASGRPITPNIQSLSLKINY